MKKYTLFLFVLLFSFGLFNINVNSVGAVNCAPGDLFNTTTGQACGNSMVVECPTGDKFSSITGKLCTVWTDNSSVLAQFNNLFKSNFKIGTISDEVKPLQQFLKEQGYYLGAKAFIDGNYGPRTETAVKNFKDDNDITNTPTAVLGDVNGDGVVDSGDALLVQQYVAGSRTFTALQTSAADVNNDGQITKADSDTILAYSVGNITSLPISYGSGIPTSALTASAPSITNVTYNTADGSMDVRGTGLNLNNVVMIDGSRDDSTRQGGPSWIAFIKVLATGRHSVQITNSQVGDSNIYYFDVINSNSITAAPTVTLSVNGSHSPSAVTAPANLAVSWTTTNSSQISDCWGSGQGWIGVGKSTTGDTNASGNLNAGNYSYYIECNKVGGGTIHDEVNITVTAPSTATLSVTKAGTGSGTVSSFNDSTNSTISCGSTCSASYGQNITVLLQAVPANVSTFTGWSGCDSTNSVGDICIVNMATAKSVTATFTATPVITALPDLQVISITPTSVTANQMVSFTATIKNVGSVNVTTPFVVNVNGTTVTIQSLGANQTTTASASSGLAIGTNQFCVPVDIFNTVAESNESNNNFCQTVTVTAPAAPATVPNLTTSPVTSITQTSAIGGGNISSNGGATVTVSGIVWSTAMNPTTALPTKTTYGLTIAGPWTNMMSGLLANTIYYVRAYAVNSVGTAYGNVMLFTTGTVVAPPTITVTSPNGGETLYQGSTYPITWTSTGLNPTDVVQIKVKNFESVFFTYSMANTGIYPWPTLISAGIPVSGWRVSVTSGAVSDSSDAAFDIKSSPLTTTSSAVTISGICSSLPCTFDGKALNNSWGSIDMPPQYVTGTYPYTFTLSGSMPAKMELRSAVWASSPYGPSNTMYVELDGNVVFQESKITYDVSNPLKTIDLGTLASGTHTIKIYASPSPTYFMFDWFKISNTSTVLGAESFHFTQFLDQGTSGNEVMELQKFLSNTGYDAGNADGIFGAKVKAALIKFQIANNLKADGIVGYEVRSFLNK